MTRRALFVALLAPLALGTTSATPNPPATCPGTVWTGLGLRNCALNAGHQSPHDHEGNAR